MSRLALEEALEDIRKDISAKGLNRIINRPEEDKTMATKKVEKTAKAEKGGYSAANLAADLGIDSVTCRKALRECGAKKPGASWNWDSKKAAAEAASKVKEFLKEAKPAKAKKAEKAPAKKVKSGGKEKKVIRKVKSSKAAEEASEAESE